MLKQTYIYVSTLLFKGTPQVQAVVGSVAPTANPTSSPTKTGEKQDNTDKSDSVSGDPQKPPLA